MKLQVKTLVALGCLSVGCTASQARVGETEAQCEERYGKPTAVLKEKSQRWYQKGDFVIVAHFYEGKCDYITFKKTGADIIGENIKDKEREVLLNANGGEKEWLKSDGREMNYIFRTTDEKLYAYHSRMPGGELMILTLEANKRRLEARKAEEEKKLKGF